MMTVDSKVIIALGCVMVLFGFVAPFLMVIRIIEPSFALSFVSHAASVGGLFLGLLGVAAYSRARRE
jgi:membrane associated rhomboid family serine protease